MATDFFDEDLLRSDPAAVAKTDAPESLLTRPLSDASITRMMRQKDEVLHQVSSATQEIEQLRQRQEQLEKEKNDLQELHRRQEEYERSKKEIIEQLVQSLVLLEKDEVQATRMVELVSLLRQRFKDTLSELRNINEADWTDDTFQMDLNKSLVIVEEARGMYKKALAKVEAVKWQKPDGEPIEPGIMGSLTGSTAESRDFIHWLKMGLAFSIPLLVVLTIFFILYLLLSGLVGGTV